MSILLTGESPEIEQILRHYWGTYEAPEFVGRDDGARAIEEACRAQLRKVVEWCEEYKSNYRESLERQAGIYDLVKSLKQEAE